ncbi:MAG TPA: hypothetical protein VK178_06270 [Opitutaceae bacterium]|nr:hypothetical protein [Opitutaceae bacterium]
MKNTRAILLVTAGLLAAAAFATALLTISLPVAALFEYATGTLVTTGLLTMLLGTERTIARPPTAPRTAPPARRACPPAPRRELAHAL